MEEVEKPIVFFTYYRFSMYASNEKKAPSTACVVLLF